MVHLPQRFARIAILALVQSALVLSQDGGTDSSTDVRLARVVIDGETLFSIRGVTAHPAERRAGEIAERIRALARNPKIIGAKSLSLEHHPGATWIMAGGHRVMTVLDEDAAIEEIAREHLAELYRARIWEAIDVYRHDRQPDFLWTRVLYALGMTVVLIAAVQLGRRAMRLLRAFLERRYRDRIEGLESRAHHIVKVDQIWRAFNALLNVVGVIAIAITVYAYLSHVLVMFPWTRAFANSLFAVAVDPLRKMYLGLIGIIPNLIFLAILTLVTRYALKIAKILFDTVAAGTLTLKGFDPDWALPTYRLLRLLVIMFAVIVAYPYIPGSGTDGFKGVSLFVGIIFSLGSSSLIGNFIAGYTMTYRRAFRMGDRVKIGDHMGDVERMRLLVTHLRTPKNEEVVVPNSVILASEVVNYSSMARESGLILHTTVGIGYEAPWRQVEAMLLEAAARTPGLLRNPRPFVLQKRLGDFCVTYEINVFCDTPQAMEEVYTELHRNILDQFNEYGVQIMTPAYETDPHKPKVVPRAQWYAAPAQTPSPEHDTVMAGSAALSR